MKISSWIRVKIKQATTDPLKELITGNYGCLRSNSCSSSNQNIKFSTLQNHVCKTSFSGEFDDMEEEEISFQGFLAIGTLGIEPPSTPKLFNASMEEDGFKEEKKEDITQDELNLINEKLEKFLQPETEQGFNLSLVRTTNLSAGNNGSSELEDDSNKTEGSNAEEHGGESVFCPLQGYLLGSSIELPKINHEVKKKKGSIREFFQRKKSAETANFSEKHEHRRKDVIKNMMRNLRGSTKKTFTPCSLDDDDSVPRKKKLRKISQIFRRKIHPVVCIAESEENKPNIDPKMDDMFQNRSFINGDLKHQHEGDNGVSSSDMSQYEVVPNRKREKWIMSDSEFLVLEL